MKKITLLALALVAIAAFTACSQGENGSSSSHQSSSSQVASSSRSFPDKRNAGGNPGNCR